jgi:hypothetical protein
MVDRVKSGFSQRGKPNVDAIMPKIQGAVANRVAQENTKIDPSTAENWLIRTELVEMCKQIITDRLQTSVGVAS